MSIFENLKNAKDIFSQMGNIQEKQLELQKRISQIRVTASSGAGLVDVTSTADGTITDVKIQESILNPKDAKLIENLVLSATNEVLRKAKEALNHEMKSIFGFNPSDMEKIMKQTGGGGSSV